MAITDEHQVLGVRLATVLVYLLAVVLGVLLGVMLAVVLAVVLGIRLISRTGSPACHCYPRPTITCRTTAAKGYRGLKE